MKMNAGVNHDPFFNRGNHIFVKAVFIVPRPLCHLVNNDPCNAIRRLFRNPFTNSLGDVDNMAKFVLDALNGVGYHDDKQVAALLSIKCNDDALSNVGKTEVTMRKMHDGDMVHMLKW